MNSAGASRRALQKLDEEDVDFLAEALRRVAPDPPKPVLRARVRWS